MALPHPIVVAISSTHKLASLSTLLRLSGSIDPSGGAGGADFAIVAIWVVKGRA